MEIIASAILLLVVYCLCKAPEWKFDRRLPPPGYKVDYGAGNNDLSSGMSKTDMMRKCNNGDYDVKK